MNITVVIQPAPMPDNVVFTLVARGGRAVDKHRCVRVVVEILDTSGARPLTMVMARRGLFARGVDADPSSPRRVESRGHASARPRQGSAVGSMLQQGVVAVLDPLDGLEARFGRRGARASQLARPPIAPYAALGA